MRWGRITRFWAFWDDGRAGDTHRSTPCFFKALSRWSSSLARAANALDCALTCVARALAWMVCGPAEIEACLARQRRHDGRCHDPVACACGPSQRCVHLTPSCSGKEQETCPC